MIFAAWQWNSSLTCPKNSVFSPLPSTLKGRMSTSSLDISKFIASLEEQYKPRSHKACQIAIVKFANFVIAESQRICPQSPPNEFIEGERGHQIQNPYWTGHSGFLRNSAFVGEP